MRAVLVPSFAAWLVVLGCGGAPAPAPPARSQTPATPRVDPAPPPIAHAPPRDRAPADPLRDVLRRRVIGVEDAVPPPLLGPLRVVELPSERKSDFWSPCVRAIVLTQPAAARELLGEALSLYSTSCTARRVEFAVPRASRAAAAPSQLALIGALEATTCEVALRAVHASEPFHAERITLIADGVRWTSPRIDFDRDGDGEVATLPLTRSLARVVRRAIEARDTLLRFERATSYEDVVVGDELKQELRVALDALDAINRP